jgi:hypothetical protein
MEPSIEQALAEIGPMLCRCGVDGVCQVDELDFVLRLFGRACFGDLLIRADRGSPRLHLLHAKVHRELCLNTQASTLLASHLSRGRIRSLRLAGTRLFIDVYRGQTRTLHVDFDRGALWLTDEGGGVLLFAPRGSAIPPPLSGGGSPTLLFERTAEPARSASLDVAPDFPVNRGLSEEYLLQRNKVLARRVLGPFRGERKKVQRLIEKLETEQQEAQEGESYRKKGELLKYSMHRLQRGVSSVRLTDFDGSLIDVSVDPLLSPQENMARYFALYKKMKRRSDVIVGKMAFERRRLTLLDELIDRMGKGELLSITASPKAFIDSLDRDSLTPAFHDRIRQLFYPVERGVKDSVKPGSFRRFLSRTGKVILVGRNGRENDELTIHQARGNDLWFHVEACAGSHVILRREGRKEFQDSDVVDAAMLALYFSPLRKAREGDVVYTFRKFLRKPKGAPPGHVIYHNNRTKHVRFDEAVLGRLLDARPKGLIVER